jgi:hypothetical protein
MVVVCPGFRPLLAFASHSSLLSGPRAVRGVG